jgi:hypothetical protein
MLYRRRAGARRDVSANVKNWPDSSTFRKGNAQTRAPFSPYIGKICWTKIAGANPAGLTDAARSEYRKHPAIGYRILNLFDDTLDLSEVVLAHHERWDGAGYPQGLREDEIPLAARILAVADAYERALHREGGRTAALQTVGRARADSLTPRSPPVSSGCSNQNAR